MSRRTPKDHGFAAKRRYQSEYVEYPPTRTPQQWAKIKARDTAAAAKKTARAERRRQAKAAAPRPTIIALRQRLAGQTFTAQTSGYKPNIQGPGVVSDEL